MPSYSGPVNVAINVAAPPGSSIFYTDNGDTPNSSATPYVGPILVSETKTIKAIGTFTGYVNSAVASVDIIIGLTVFFGYSPLTSLNEAQLIAITNSPLTNTAVQADSLGNYNFGSASTASDYFYFWWPDTFTDPSVGNGFFDQIGGFAVAMATTTEGFTNGPVNGYYYKALTVNGVSGKLFRTYYAIGGGGQTTILVQ
jgi:hypothetical protein